MTKELLDSFRSKVDCVIVQGSIEFDSQINDFSLGRDWNRASRLSGPRFNTVAAALKDTMVVAGASRITYKCKSCSVIETAYFSSISNKIQVVCNCGKEYSLEKTSNTNPPLYSLFEE